MLRDMAGGAVRQVNQPQLSISQLSISQAKSISQLATTVSLQQHSYSLALQYVSNSYH